MTKTSMTSSSTDWWLSPQQCLYGLVFKLSARVEDLEKAGRVRQDELESSESLSSERQNGLLETIRLQQERIDELEKKIERLASEKEANETPLQTTASVEDIVRRPKAKKVLRSEVTLPPSVNKTIDSRLDRGKHFESNCTCWQGQTAADCEKETISRRSSSTVCTHSNTVVTGDRVGTPWGRHRANFTGKSCLPQLILSQFTHKSVPV